MKTSPGSSSTFTRPPLDGSLTYPKIFDYNAQHSPHHPVFQFFDQDHIHKVTWSEVTKAIHAAGRIALESVPRTDSTPVVGVLANADGITFLTVIAGIIRAGYTAFPISTRNSPAAVAYLLKSTGCKNLFELARMQNGINTIPMPTFEDLYLKNDSEPLSHVRPDWEQLALIVHSSGSTRFPRPIPYTHRFYTMHGIILFARSDIALNKLAETLMFADTLCPRMAQRCIVRGFVQIKTNIVLTITCEDLMGCWTIMAAASDGVTIAVFPPENPPIVPTPERVMEGIIATKCTIVFCVPHFYEAWAHDPAAVEALTKATVAVFGGGPLAKSAGDSLVAKGVPLCALFGSTETTFSAKMMPKEMPAEGWEWFEVGLELPRYRLWLTLSSQWASYLEYVLVPVEGEENMFHVVIKEYPKTGYSPAVFNTTINGVRAYDTTDLFIRHPTNPKMFKCYGRHSMVHLTQSFEKTNPTPIGMFHFPHLAMCCTDTLAEKTITTDKRIAAAVMFGRSRFQPGVLVSPAPGYEFDPTNEKDLADFRASIWDTVSKANEEAPQHSRIFKEMIIVTHPSKPFMFTSKETLRRPAILEAYSREIEAAYEAVNNVSVSNIPAPQKWNIDEIEDWIRHVVHNLLPADAQISDTQDLFVVGVNSHRNPQHDHQHPSENHAISTGAIRALSQNFVFSNPSISLLSAFVHDTIISSQSNGTTETEDEDDGKSAGGAGLAFDFRSYPEKFRTAVWTVQVTPDAPMTSLEDLVAFYRRKIKEEQPTGPYRFAGYSASCILAFLIAQEFERHGDTVSQLAILDLFPSIFLHQIPAADSPNRQNEFIATVIKIMLDLTAWDKSRKSSVDALRYAFNGTARKLAGMIGDFCLQPDIERWMGSMKDVKAPVTVYVPGGGGGARLVPLPREEQEDLGASRWVPEVRVVRVPGGHMDFLEHDLVVAGLQEGYL
ncbi:acetyl-CoA synthetase-like protein [Armillaria gallica]|uniref:Acetyl-CoA synthetase-like protein n=1 Tax=Armillaria gallica TaxID=47427 RepID=A0A2H3D980_ARMGA|nr:acetyl-CoA synthetase-like protein [Armillaria gallica]